MAVVETLADGVGASDLLAVDRMIQGQVLSLYKGESVFMLLRHIKSQDNGIICVLVKLFYTQWIK